MLKETTLDEPQKSNNNPIISGVLDWHFNRYLTMQLLPFFYVALIIAAILSVAAMVITSFLISPLAGVLSLCVSPLALFFIIAIIRATLEYLVMAHRIMLIVENMNKLPTQVTDLSGKVDRITNHVDQLIDRVDNIHDTLMEARPLIRSATIPNRILEVLRGPKRNIPQHRQ